MASNLPISFSDFLRITSANTGESQKILDAYSDLRVGEEFLGAYRKGELRKFTDADGEILQKAVDTLRKSLTGEYDQFGEVVKSRVPLNEIPAIYDAFEKAIDTMSPNAYNAFKRRVDEVRGDETSQQKRLDAIIEKHRPHPATTKPKKEVPIAEPENIVERPQKPKEESPATWKWPTDKPEVNDKDLYLKVAPVISEIINAPMGEGKRLGEKKCDEILALLNHKLSAEEFDKEAHNWLPTYYKANVNVLEEKIAERQKEANENPDKAARLQKDIKKFETQIKEIAKMNANLHYLYENWKPHMDKQSNLVKTIGNYKVSLRDKEILLETSQISAALRFSSVAATCKKFIEINTEAEVESAFDVDTLLAMEKEAYGSLVHVCRHNAGIRPCHPQNSSPELCQT